MKKGQQDFLFELKCVRKLVNLFIYNYTHYQIYKKYIDFILIIPFLGMNLSTHKEALDFLEKMRHNIKNIKQNKEDSSLMVLKQINQRIMACHLGVIILLHNKEYLIKLLEFVVKYHKNCNNKGKKEEIEKQVEIIYSFGLSCFFIYEDAYRQFLSYFQNKLSKAKIEENQKIYAKENQRYELMAKIVKDFHQIYRSNVQNFQKGKKLNQFIERFKLQNIASVYEEPIYTYLRKRIQILQNEIIKKIESKQFGFCCRLHFLQNAEEKGVQTFAQNFHRYAELQKEKQNITKQIVSYLNSYGGIFYLGIEISPDKKALFHGIMVDQTIRKKILSNILQQIVIKIFPDDEENDDQDQEKQQFRIQEFKLKKKKEMQDLPFDKSKYQYDVTKYISIDFTNLYSAETWFYSRQNSTVLYVIRIKVKKGDQYEVYHYVNQNQVPKAYYREDKKEKELTMIEYYDEIYRKLKNKAEERHQVQKVSAFHPLCRFKIKLEQNLSK